MNPPQGTPQSPQYGYNGYSPNDTQHFHQQSNGQFDMLPTPQAAPNDGRSGHNPYEFIVNPNTAKSNGLNFSLAGGNFLAKIGLLLGGVVLIIIVAALAISAFTPKGSAAGMTSIAERQQEIIRISTAAERQTQSQDAQNFVTNVSASITSSQSQILSYMKSHGTKVGSKTLALDQNAQTDTALSAAQSANNYDDAVAQDLVSQLQAYQVLLKTTFTQTNSTSAKQILQQNYNGAALLIKQGTALEQELQN